MADEKTITTIFKADISQFSASTQELNQYVRTVNSEFNNAVAGMGKWSDTTDGLTAKITQLNKILDAEKLKLQDLEKRYKELEDAGKGNTKEAKNLAIAINDQQAKIKKTERQVEDYTDSLEKMKKEGVKSKKELDKFAKSAKNAGTESEKASKKIAGGLGKALSAIATLAATAVTGFFALAESTRETRLELGRLETAFEDAGFTAEEAMNTYKEFNAVLGDTKKSTETMQQLAMFADTQEELTNYTTILTGVFAKLGDALPTESLAEAINHTIQLGEVQGSLADALEWAGVTAEDFNEELAKCTTEEERSALIQETLIKLYGKAAEKYKETNKEIIEAEKASTNLSLAFADLGKIAEPIMTSLKNATADLVKEMEPFVKLMADGLTGAFAGAEDGAKKFAEGLQGILDLFLQEFNNLLPTVVNLVIQLIPAIIDSLLNALPDLIQTITTIFVQIVQAIAEMLPQIIESVVGAIPIIIQAILQALPQLAQALISFAPEIAKAAIVLFMAIVDAIPVIMQALITEMPNIINTIITQLLDAIPLILQAAINLLMAIVDAIPTIITALVRDLPKIISTIVTTLVSRVPDIVQAAVQLFMGLITAIPIVIGQLILKLPEIITSIVNGLLEGMPQLILCGGQLLAGLFKGMLDPKAIWEGVKGLFNGIVGGIKKIFGIKSPSKVMKEKIGENLALGISEGFVDEMDTVSQDMTKALKKVTPALQIDSPTLAPFGGGSDWVSKLAEMMKGNQPVVNNYNFEYKFEKMETSKLALHKAKLETMRIVGG